MEVADFRGQLSDYELSKKSPLYSQKQGDRCGSGVRHIIMDSAGHSLHTDYNCACLPT
jgi:hypothetical protein